VLPTLPQLRLPLRDLSLSLLATVAVALVLARFLPQTPIFNRLVSQTVSGAASVAAQEQQLDARVGQTGVTLSDLRPGGRARFGEQLLDVVTQGEMIAKGRTVRIISRTGANAVVAEVQADESPGGKATA
jgi:membrane-bound serine protease (ClpP class)